MRERRITQQGSPLKGKKKGVRFAEPSQPVNMAFGFRVIRYILRHPVNRATLMRKHVDQVKDLLAGLRGYLALAEVVLENPAGFGPDDHEAICAAWEVSLKTAVLLLTVNKRDVSMTSLAEWAETHLSMADQSSALVMKMANFFANCSSSLLSAGLLHHPDDTALVANVNIALAKHLSASGPFDLVCPEVVVPLAKVLVQLSVTDTSDTTMTTSLFKRLVQCVAKGMTGLEVEECQKLAPETQLLTKSFAQALENSQEDAVYGPIFKLIKSEISRLNTEVRKI